MTCTGCQAKVQELLSQIPGVQSVSVDLAKAAADIEMKEHISTQTFRNMLAAYPKYQITESEVSMPVAAAPAEVPVSWIATYKPILLIFGYILTVALIAGYHQGHIRLLEMMRIFMGGFFLTFSFFKLLNIKGFAESYAMYDVLAMRWKAWGYIYALLELALGLAFITEFRPLMTNIVTLMVMSLSIIGVLQSVLSHRKIQCACLGAVFNLPMSTVTIIEDGLMIAMSGIMIAGMI